MENYEDDFDIRAVVPDDIQRLAQIHVVTCMADNAFRLYFDTAEEFTERVVDMLKGQVGDSTWYHAKVVDKKSGTIAAWASWETPTSAQIQQRARQIEVERLEKEQRQPGENEGNSTKGQFEFPPGLPQYVQQDTDRWIVKASAGNPHILLKALFTDPLFQRRGMGNALVHHGNCIADKNDLPILLQASAYGWPVYTKQGFNTAQHLDVDLREWAPGAQNNDKGYGNYRFRYMMRPSASSK